MCKSASSSVLTIVQFSRSAVSNSLQPPRPPCPSPTPRVHPNPRPLSRWCHPTISFFIIPFSGLQSFPASRSFQMSQLFVSGGQSIGASASASVLSMNIQSWFPLGFTDLISLQSKGLKSLLQHHSSQASILWCSASFMIQLSCPSSQWCPSNHLILCRLLLLPSISPSIRVFSNESVLHIRWPKYWNFSFSISPSKHLL